MRMKTVREIVILILAAVNCALGASLLLKKPSKPADEIPPEPEEMSAQAKFAEQRFSEGVLNVLAYENPAGRGSGE